MEVVVLLVAIVGVALIVIPRLQRRKAGGHRPSTPRKRVSTPVVAAAAVPASSAAAWAPPPGASADEDGWEDDLGWEGEAEPAPGAREAWEEWRSSTLTGSPEAAAAPEPEVPELPSVDRWRARADSEDEWAGDDDDGLGWEGEDEPPAPAGLWNGDGRSGAPAGPVDWAAGRDAGGGRDFSRGAPPPAVAPESAPAFATASATDIAASESDPELGRTVALDESEEWGSPVTRTWGTAASRP